MYREIWSGSYSEDDVYRNGDAHVLCPPKILIFHHREYLGVSPIALKN